MRKFVIVFTLLMLFCAVIPFVSAEQTLSIYYFHRPPLYIKNDDGSVGGFLAEIVQLVVKDTGITYQFSELPNKRILENLKQPEYACGIGWFKNPEREEFAYFTDPIYQDLPLAIVINKDKLGTFPENPTIEQLLTSALTLGVTDGFSYGTWADDAIAKFQPKIGARTGGGEQASLLMMLEAGRYNYTLMGVEEATWLLQNDPTLSGKLAIIPISDAPVGNLRYIMCSRGVDESVIQKMNTSIAKITQTDEYKRLTDFSALVTR